MKKGEKVLALIFIIGFIIILSVNVVSAGWWGDFWNNILGKNPQNNFNSELIQTGNSDIRCNLNLDCGTNGWIGDPFCQSGNVYQTARIFLCGNPGTTSSVCSNYTNNYLKQTCGSGETCSNGACVNSNIRCYNNTQCGTNGYVGNLFCQSGNVYQNYLTYACNSPGTTSSSCSNTTSPQLKQTCSTGQTCTNGVCINTGSSCTDSDVTSDYPNGKNPFLKGGVINGNYKLNDSCSGNQVGVLIEYFCYNITQYSFYLFNCSSIGQSCSDGACISGGCSNDCSTSGSKRCSGNYAQVCGNYDQDSCLEWNTGELCSNGCNATNGNCNSQTCTPKTCSQLGKQCGTWDNSCGGTVSCPNCSSGQTCSNGQCVNTGSSCTDSDATNEYPTGKNPFLKGGVVNGNFKFNDSCSGNQPGILVEYFCWNSTQWSNYAFNCTSIGQPCSNGACISGGCSNDCSTSGSKRCSGNYAQVCGNYDQDSCLEWNTGELCSNGCNATNGNCNSQTCTPKTCSQLGKQCGTWDNSCGGTVSCPNCSSGQTCSNGTCSSTCSNECTTSGTKRCSGNYAQVCGNYDQDSCLEWNTGELCSNGCNATNGNCISTSGCTSNSQCNDNIACTYDYCYQSKCIFANGCPSGQRCDEISGRCAGSCVPNCTGKQCGGDGCNGLCSPGCSEDKQCIGGICSCPAKSCKDLNKNCGNVDNGCGQTINCGSCGNNQNCDNGQCKCNTLGNVFSVFSIFSNSLCCPRTCKQLSKECGNTDDGCGTQINCGGCDDGKTCNNNKCIIINNDKGLIAYYPFEGNANDATGNGNDGVPNGVNLVQGIFGYAYNFTPNTNITIPITNKLKLGKEITISAWIKTNGLGNNHAGMSIFRRGIDNYSFVWPGNKNHVSGYNEYLFGLNYESDLNLRFNKRYNTTISPNGGIPILTSEVDTFCQNPDDGQWHLVTGELRSDKTMHLYIDGSERTSENSNHLYFNVTDDSNVQIIGGNDNGIPGIGYKGFIDELKVWNYALNNSEIKSELARRLTGKDLIVYFSNEGCSEWYWTGNFPNRHFAGRGLVYDKSGFGNHLNTFGDMVVHSGIEDVCYSAIAGVGGYPETLYLYGNGDHGEINNSNFFNLGSFTISVWINTTEAGNGRRMIISQQDSNDNYFMALNNDILEFGSSKDAISTIKGNKVNNGIWHHLVIVRDTGNKVVYWYVDGSIVGQQSITNTDSYNINSNIFIGSGDKNLDYKGLLDEVKIWNYAINSSSIVSEYKRGISSIMPPSIYCGVK